MKRKFLFLIPTLTMALHSSAIAQDVHPALKNVAAEIDTSAEYVTMNKLSGDLTVLSQYLQLILDTARNHGEKIPATLNAHDLLEVIGARDIKAIGASSTKQDNAWLNRSFLDNGGSNKAIFTLLGAKNQDYIVPTICPAGTDLALQLQLDLRQAEQLILQIANMAGEGDKVKSNLANPIPELNITTSQLLAKLNIRVNIAIDLDDNDFIPTPFGKIGKPRIIARIDGVAWMWEKIGDKLMANADVKFNKSEANGIITYTLPKDITDNPRMMNYSPRLVIDKANNHIWFATTPDFLKLCQSGQNTLADSPEFKAAFQGLPAKATSLGYVSKHFLNEVDDKYKALAAAGMLGNDFDKAKPLVDRILVDITESDKGWAFALNRGDQGITCNNRGPLATKHLEYASSLVPFILSSYKKHAYHRNRASKRHRNRHSKF